VVVRLDAAADHAAGMLRVNAIHEDVTIDKAMTAAVNDQIRDLSRWLGLDLLPARRPSSGRRG
jgi:uncharacterized protein YcaQ